MAALAKGFGSGARLYYKTAGKEFDGELAAVGQGIAAHCTDANRSGLLFLMRRNVHMLEKGLTMRPRRAVFAEGYICETVGGLARFATTAANYDNEEIRWMFDVIEEYFAATATATSPVVAHARHEFERLVEEVSSDRDPHLPKLIPRAPTLGLGVVDVDDLAKLAATRRSVRWYIDRKVDRDSVTKAIAIGLRAPTACNRQPYRLIVIDDRGKVSEVAEIPMGTKGYHNQIPGIIVVVGDLSAFFSERDRHLIYIDSCLASMGIILGLEAQGIASCCINWPDVPEREKRMRKALSLSPYERVVMLIAYGYADPDALAPRSARRVDREVFGFWEHDTSITPGAE